jgi:hypothetical protein
VKSIFGERKTKDERTISTVANCNCSAQHAPSKTKKGERRTKKPNTQTNVRRNRGAFVRKPAVYLAERETHTNITSCIPSRPPPVTQHYIYTPHRPSKSAPQERKKPRLWLAGGERVSSRISLTIDILRKGYVRMHPRRRNHRSVIRMYPRGYLALDGYGTSTNEPDPIHSTQPDPLDPLDFLDPFDPLDPLDPKSTHSTRNRSAVR